MNKKAEALIKRAKKELQAEKDDRKLDALKDVLEQIEQMTECLADLKEQVSEIAES